MLDDTSSANSFASEVEKSEASVESTLVSKVASTSELTITVTLGELTVVNNGGYDEVRSKTTEKKADFDVAKHSTSLTRQLPDPPEPAVWTLRPQR